ncbi:MAG: hypothetical protein V3W41_06670 [Planctomycetota bacterium]
MISFGPATLSLWLTLFTLSFGISAGELDGPVAAPPSLQATRLGALAPNTHQEKTRFIRYSKGRKIQRLETAIVQYRSEEADLDITLVSAVHIGDRSYYDSLQKKLQPYPHVLFEGLKPDPELNEDSLLTLLDRLQNQLKDYLALEHQRDRLVTTGKNFVHADLSAKDVQQRLKEAKITLVPAANIVQSMGPLLSRFLKALEPKEDGKTPAFLNLIRDRAKRSLAQVLGDGNAYYQRFKRREEEKRDAIIIEARNEHALLELDRLRGLKTTRRVAILYGAGHMADFERRLKKRMPDLSLRKVEWLAAWTIGKRPPTKKTPKKPAKSPEGKKI